MKKKIIFFYTDTPQKQLLEYISNKIDLKKFSIDFSTKLGKSCDIGIYAHDADKIKKINSTLSIITLGGMDQGKLFWPNFWLKENWNKFDFGILPGNKWAKMWKESTWFRGSRPKKAMLLTGWPKSIEIKKKQKKSRKIKTVLYAPCLETDNKQLDVVNALKNSKINLIIKHLPWDAKNELTKFKDIRNNIKKSNKLTKNILGKRVKIINPKTNIMKCFDLVDLLITDESSVMYEALLYNLPSLSCEDWPMRINNNNAVRKIKKDKNVCIYTKQKTLSKSIEYCLANLHKLQKITKKKKRYHFSHINNSAENINTFLINYFRNRKILFEIKPKFKINYFKTFLVEIKNYLFK